MTSALRIDRMPLFYNRHSGAQGGSMEDSDVLIGLAQIAIAIVGFSGLVSVFRSVDRVWRPDARFWSMMTQSIATLAFAVLPLPFIRSEIAPEYTWSICSILFASFSAVFGVIHVRDLRRRVASGQYYKSQITTFLIVSLIIVVVVLVLNALGLVFGRSFTPYLACLVAYTVGSTLAFIRMIYMSFVSNDKVAGKIGD